MIKQQIDYKVAISIIIATFNSERTLPLVLESIKRQTFPQKKIEILILDGGSEDKTLTIAKKYQCTIIKNKKIEPISGRILGYEKAKGKYIIFIDSDEIIKNPESITIKYELMEKNHQIKAVIGSGYENPPHAAITAKYINEFGDPFSFFIYRSSKNAQFFITQMKQAYPVSVENEKGVLFNFSQSLDFPIMELGAANTMIDAEYSKKTFPDFSPEIFAHLFYFLLKNSKKIAFTKDDPVVHYTSDTMQSYINKIKWRVKNNIYYVSSLGITGFSGRSKLQSSNIRIKRYFFLPYAITIIFPLIDAVYLVITRKDLAYFIHLPLSFYTATVIMYYYCLKIVGYKPELRSYGEAKVIRA
jgi:glycosyltransferase involved in cell wall biosynthesis